MQNSYGRSVIEKTQAQNSELDSKFISSEANYAQVNKKLGMAEAGFQTDRLHMLAHSLPHCVGGALSQ